MTATSPPFKGNLPQVKNTLGKSSPEIAAGNLTKSLMDIQRDIQNGKEASDVDPKGKGARGGTKDQTVLVTFKKANNPVFMSHDFGYTVRNWHVVDIDGAARVYRPTGARYKYSTKGIWLACDTDNVKARIRIDGQKGVA